MLPIQKKDWLSVIGWVLIFLEAFSILYVITSMHLFDKLLTNWLAIFYLPFLLATIIGIYTTIMHFIAKKRGVFSKPLLKKPNVYLIVFGLISLLMISLGNASFGSMG